MANGSLQRYREMRDFARTPEPRGERAGAKAQSSGKSFRYYIQRHHATRLHYDFRLELGGVLKSWAVPKGPSLDPAVKRLAMQTEDHPLEYGEFEGTIPEKQYGAGDVLLWDMGEWIPEDKDPDAALRKGRLHFELRGKKLRGSWVLTRTFSGESKPAWLLIKRNDDEARHGEEDVVVQRPESVKKAPAAEKRPRRLKRAKKETWIPEFVAPQLATLVSEPPRSGDWLYEIKYDGYRLMARFSGGEVKLFTRTGNDWSSKLPHLLSSLERLHLKDTLLDGEIVVPGPDGRASFQALQNAFEHGGDARVVYYVFDAPYLEGKDLRRLPLVERKKFLGKAIPKKASAVRLSEDLSGSGKEVLEKACELGLEGLIGKQAGSVYVSGRSKSWIKLKCRRRQDFVIGGYTPPKGSRSGFGAILVGFYDERGKLTYAGKVGTGFGEEALSSLSRKFSSLKRPDPPFANPPREKGVQWLRPQLVAEVAYAEKTDEGILRQPAFMGLRQDLPAKSVREEKPVSMQPNSVLGIAISHPDRLIWPEEGFSKLDLARYCEAVGDALLSHLKNRPLSLVRCPDGVGKQCFFQRHLKGRKEYFSFDSLEQVIGAVQNGAVEFHTWGSTGPDVQHPDRIVLDLDPGPGVTWKKLVQATRMTKALLDGLGLESFLKTTGGKGLHVVVPLEPKLGWDEVKDFSRRMAEFLVRAEPKLFVATMTKSKRDRKVFVDYLRNAETASAVAAWSPRARPGARVSTPVAWDELGDKDLRPLFTVRSVLKRLEDDPWRGYWRVRQSITTKMRGSL